MYYNYKILYLFVALFFGVSVCWSQENDPPSLTAIGNQPYCPLSQIKIVTDFNIVDRDDTEIEALFVQISTGYTFGEDTLFLVGSHPNITTSWNASEGKLTLIGTSALASYVDLVAAIKDVEFRSNSINPIDKFFSFTIGDANYLPSTDHYYEYVPFIGITWTSAKADAETRKYYGLQGYLATIITPEEAQLAGEQSAGAGWIGGSDATSEGLWRWVTGPENGTVFWNGGINGSTPNYANWNTDEPNNLLDEDYAHVTAPGIGKNGSWNDLSNSGDPIGDYQPKGYVVEYGGMPGDPDVDISASTRIYTISIRNVTGASRCGNGSLTLSASPSSGTVYWFDSETGGTPLDSGLTYKTPTLNATKTFYALASENQCLVGARTPVVATLLPIPSIVSATGNLICKTGSSTLSATASAGVINWYGSLSGGTSLGTGNTFTTPVISNTTTYYVDATINGCTSLTRTPVTLTVPNTALPTANVLQTFCDVENAKIIDLTITGTDIKWYNNSTGGSPLNDSDALTNTTYYATQTISTCESSTRLAVNVIINETVVALQPSEIPTLEECDSMQDGDDANGYSTFNLSENETILLNGKTASDFTFFYFTDLAYTVPIPTADLMTFQNTRQGNQTIYVRIANSIESSCFTDTFFDIKVNELPSVQSSIVFINCDGDEIPDGFTNFNLEEANDIITNGDSTGFTITYYMSSNQAEIGASPINPIPFNNKMVSVVYARVENDITGECYKVCEVNLQVSTTLLPAGYIKELEFCDDIVKDGFREFDLTQISPLFIDEFPLGQNLSVHYYKNLNDAQLEQNEILSQTDYVNETPFSQTLYVRVESENNGECFAMGPHLVLTVHPKPEFEINQSEIYCLDNAPITLTTFNPVGVYTYEWKNENDEVVGNLSSLKVSSGGTYTVIATSIGYICTSIPVEFKVVESAIASIGSDDVTIVELSDNNTITINNNHNNLGIGDYEFALDAVFGPYQDQSFFDRVGAGVHTIFVRDKNKCGIAEIEVFVLGFPKFFTPNNDGNNDTWNIKGLRNEFSQNSTIYIYDRYGKFIKQINLGSQGWNGLFNGRLLPSSDYWYVAKLIDLKGKERIFRGHFSLII